MLQKFFLLLVLMSSVFIACQSTDKVVETQSISNENNQNITEPESETTTSALDNLIEANFNGETFSIYGSNTINGMDFATLQQFHEGSETGEPVNDTLYQRDRFIEEKYNVKINNIVIDGNLDQNVVTKSVLAGDNEFDIFYGDSASAGAPLFTNKVLVDMYTVPNINFNADYWHKSAQEALTIDGKYYFATGSLTPRFYGAIYALSFNKNIHEDYGLSNFYDIVLNNQWTIDVFMENCRSISTDVNGDGVMDENDLYGFGYEILTPEALYIGCGYNIITNVNGELTFTLDDPGAVTLIQKLKSFFWEKDVCFYYTKKDTDLMFIEGNLLFNNPCIFVLEQFRDMDDDYGILPMPKLNESQEQYISYSQPWANSCVYIPISNTDLDRAGTIIEALAVYGDELIKPAVYDNVLLVKGTRDEESAQVIDLMMSHIRYDMASMFKFGKIIDIFRESMISENGEITSLYAANEESGKAAIQELLNVVR